MNISAAHNLVSDVEARNFSTKKRKKMAKSGTAKPDGSYPINDAEDVHNAVQDFHRSSDATPSDKAHIRSRAKALGMGDPFGEVKAGGPGSGRKPGEAHFNGTADLASALKRAAEAHHGYEKGLGHPDADWHTWYAQHMVDEQK